MISYLEGTLVSTGSEDAIIEVGGVGWQLQISGNTNQKLPPTGNKVRIYTYLQVRDDALVLYGFHSTEERALFLELITVTGIGPKGAIKILSALPAQTLRGAILSGDLAALTKIPGVGKKTAQRITLELRGKLEQQLPDSDLPPTGSPSADAVGVLLNLGYNRGEALSAVEQIAASGEEDTSQMVKKALQVLSGGRR
jgi:Holliday junction DNA helicase RuvA